MHHEVWTLAALAVVLAAGPSFARAATTRAAKALPPELPAETLTTLPEIAQAERVYVAHLSVSHLADGRVRVFDARGGKLPGTVSAGSSATSA